MSCGLRDVMEIEALGPAVGATAVVVILGAFGVALSASAGVLLTATGLAGTLCFGAWALAEHGSDFLDGGTFTRASWEATVQAGFDAVAPFQQTCGLPTATR